MIQFVKKRDGRVVPFEPEKIAHAIERALKETGEGTPGLSKKLAEKVIKTLETRFVGLFAPPGVEEIQDVVEEVLMSAGLYRTARAYILYRYQHKQMRELRDLVAPDAVEDYLNEADWRVRENANMSFSLQGLNVFLTEKIISKYWLSRVYPSHIRKAHENGDFHIHDLGTLGPYTYYGKEVVIARIDGRIKLLSFEQLFDALPDEPILLDAAEDAFAKYPKNVYVLDKDGWVKVKQVTRKKKNRPMRFLKNRGGRSVIVTDNHPMITLSGEKEAKDVGSDDSLFTVDVTRLLEQESLFSVEKLDLLELLRKYKWEKDALFYDGVPLEELDENIRPDGIVHTLTFAAPRYIRLTEDFGYFVGFALAEGYLTYDKGASHRISLYQKEKEPLLRANKGLLDNGFFGTLTHSDGRYVLRVKNPFLRFLFERVFNIRPGARHKSLPVEILHYAKPFVKGVIAGLIDGDGSLETSGTTLSLRIASRTLLEQLAIVMELLGFTPRDRAIEGQGTEHVYNGKKITQRYPLYGMSFRKIEEDLPSEKYRSAAVSTKAWHDEGRNEWHRVINNEPVEIPDEVIYDITTESGTLIVNGMWNHNCVGWDLRDLLLEGFRGARGKIEARPAKHFQTALLQVVNFLYTLQGEAAGAQAFSNVDTYLAPFIRADNLSYREVKQAMQELIYNLNVPTRVGFQTPFVNFTLDLEVPEFMGKEPVIIGGKVQNSTYGEYQREMDMFNRAFAEVMIEGDAKGRPFTFPIPTYNIVKGFDWGNPTLGPIWEMTAKYGIPYFANFVNSDMRPEDVRSMCCHLRLSNKELRKRGGGLFGANPLTGSIGVVTINLPRIGYLARNEGEFLERLEELMELAKQSLVIKRKLLERLTEAGLYPYSRFWLRGVKQASGEYWRNHFSTIGIIGMNEACLNLFGEDLSHPECIAFAERVLDFMNGKLVRFQEETGHLWNLEATPAEGTSYRLALLDKKRFPTIVVANEEEVQRGAAPYYTNSTHLPVDFSDDLYRVLKLQDPLQVKYTGGTVLHIWLGERAPSGEAVKALVRQIVHHFRLPYFTITPTFSVCPSHGYLAGERERCPKCGSPAEVYSRVVGYLRPVEQWNAGKKSEFARRLTFDTGRVPTGG